MCVVSGKEGAIIDGMEKTRECKRIILLLMALLSRKVIAYLDKFPNGGSWNTFSEEQYVRHSGFLQSDADPTRSAECRCQSWGQ